MRIIIMEKYQTTSIIIVGIGDSSTSAWMNAWTSERWLELKQGMFTISIHSTPWRIGPWGIFVCFFYRKFLIGSEWQIGAQGILMGEFCTFNLYNVSKNSACSNYFISSSTRSCFFTVLMSWADVNEKILLRKNVSHVSLWGYQSDKN